MTMRGMFDEINSALDAMEADVVELLQRRGVAEHEIGDLRHEPGAITDEAAAGRFYAGLSPLQIAENFGRSESRARAGTEISRGLDLPTMEAQVNPAQLLAGRIVSYNGADERTRPYDMLRTQVLQAMDLEGWKLLGVTSPTPGCGKTVTAINLAFSVSRQQQQSVVLVDLDLQNPQVANSLGLEATNGDVLDVLNGRATLQSAAIPVRAGSQKVVVLPATATKVSSELMSSQAMHDLLQDLRISFQSHVVILDLPPMLSSDDVIAVLPQIDCVLLVMAVGQSTISEFHECATHLQSSHLVRVVVNKATDANCNYSRPSKIKKSVFWSV